MPDKDKDKEKDPEKEKDEKAEAAPATKKGGRRKILLLGLPVLGAILGVVATMAVPKANSAGKAKEKEEDGPESHINFCIPDVKANLARSGGLHFCGAEFLVQVKTRKPDALEMRLGLRGGGGGEGGARSEAPPLQGPVATAVRDRIILLLNAKSIDDLEGRDKKELLKKEIREELETIIFPDKDGEIETVLFKDLLIQ
jgi:flagellar basal body-associated protein FliL